MNPTLHHISIEEMATKLGLPHHLILFWQKKFNCFRLVLRPEGQMIAVSDASLVAGIYSLLQNEGCTLRDVQRLLKQKGVSHVASFGKTMVAGAEKFNGHIPGDLSFNVNVLDMDEDQSDFEQEDEDEDENEPQSVSSQSYTPSYEIRPAPAVTHQYKASFGMNPSGRPSLGADIAHSSLASRYASSVMSVNDAQERVSIFDIATGAQPAPSINTGMASVSSTKDVENIAYERTQATLSSDQETALRYKAQKAEETLSHYDGRIDVTSMPSASKMSAAIAGLMQTLQKLDTLHDELENLQTSLKDSLETMGFSGFRNAYKDYDERRFELDVSVV